MNVSKEGVRVERPVKCEKCGSLNIKIKYCQGASVDKKTGRVGHLITGIDAYHGFVCKRGGEHFHYLCNECGFAKCV